MDPPLKPLAPRRKELPCEFAPSKTARAAAFRAAAVGVGLAALFLFIAYSGFHDDQFGTGLGIGALGLVCLAGAWFMVDSARMSVLLDDDGIVVRRPGRARRVAWTDVASIAFGAQRKREHAGMGVRGAIVRAMSEYIDDPRLTDPYFVGRGRSDYEPSATVKLEGPGRGLQFTETLGWAFFLALYAESEARRIPIHRV